MLGGGFYAAKMEERITLTDTIMWFIGGVILFLILWALRHPWLRGDTRFTLV